MMFWLFSALLCLIIALICFYPLLKKQHNQIDTKRDSLNKAFYFDRLKEIEQDEQQGLLDNASQLKTELQQALLEDIPAQDDIKPDETSYSKLWFVSGFLSLLIIASAVYFKVGAWQSQLIFEKAYEQLPHFYERIKTEDTDPLTDQELQQFATALRVKLQKEPNDPKGWWTLGQIGMSLNNGNLAFGAYDKALKLDPNNLEYKLSYTRILMMSDDDSEKLQGETLLKEVIRQDHSNLQALGLLAFYYFSKEDYKMAAVTWVMMLKLMPEDDDRRALIEKSIRSARDAVAEQEKEKSQTK
ncbi:cytochrome c-type biogenesis protein CcmI [Pasteurella langaaensis DSM 22999]|uniref:Cytochrome c-type biogenesis protein CcmI n=1 Tax=Alitibacter langaaensis DSM 22999 TaxID=1122935 RepID=A0A2U0THG1_9PAST|nr:c-type cytochrome biogenesis protein CcmI [Pasteurella langaaensis]PVX42984.1 cytochrome c-type biogenesis protein CcmI [Pasteurella langaaensis DSM 22999]